MAQSPYTMPQWRRLRLQILERDGYMCQIKGPKCTKRATAVDHIVPVNDGGAFYDPTNLRAACQWCNSWRANRQKRNEGWRRSNTHIVLVMGPPTAGKSTYIREHAGPHDLVIDYDALQQAMGNAPRNEVREVHNALLRRVQAGDAGADTVWIHSANPRAEEQFPHHEVVLLDPGEDEAMERAKRERPEYILPVIENWYASRGEPSRREW